MISSNNTSPKDWYAGNYKLHVSSHILGSGAATFDASDLMPAAVGSGSFWTQTVAWVNAGGTDTDAICGHRRQLACGRSSPSP